MSDIEFAQGIYFNKPHEKAPDFVLGSLSIRTDVFLGWLDQQPTNEKGYVRLKINVGKESGKPYVAVDDWKPEGAEGVSPGGNYPERTGSTPKYEDEEFEDGIPF